MVVQPAMAVAQAMPVDDDYDDEEEEEERPKKKTKKKKKKVIVEESTASDENWLKASILIGILLITVVTVVLVFVVPIWQHKSAPKVVQGTGTMPAINNSK